MLLKKTNIDKILLVDDDSDDCWLFAEALKNAAPSVELLVAHDVNEMRGLLQHHLPDLIVMDINMPGNDGFECLGFVKSDPLFRTIPVIMHSVSTASPDISASYALGAYLYFHKPSHFSVLVEGLQKLLSYDWMHPRRVQERHVFDGQFLLFNPLGQGITNIE